MAGQSLTMQQNFNADELTEEKELFDNDLHSDNGDYDNEEGENDTDDFSNWLDAFPVETVNKFLKLK